MKERDLSDRAIDLKILSLTQKYKFGSSHICWGFRNPTTMSWPYPKSLKSDYRELYYSVIRSFLRSVNVHSTSNRKRVRKIFAFPDRAFVFYRVPISRKKFCCIDLQARLDLRVLYWPFTNNWSTSLLWCHYSVHSSSLGFSTIGFIHV